MSGGVLGCVTENMFVCHTQGVSAVEAVVKPMYITLVRGAFGRVTPSVIGKIIQECFHRQGTVNKNRTSIFLGAGFQPFCRPCVIYPSLMLGAVDDTLLDNVT